MVSEAPALHGGRGSHMNSSPTEFPGQTWGPQALWARAGLVFLNGGCRSWESSDPRLDQPQPPGPQFPQRKEEQGRTCRGGRCGKALSP